MQRSGSLSEEQREKERERERERGHVHTAQSNEAESWPLNDKLVSNSP